MVNNINKDHIKPVNIRTFKVTFDFWAVHSSQLKSVQVYAYSLPRNDTAVVVSAWTSARKIGDGLEVRPGTAGETTFFG